MRYNEEIAYRRGYRVTKYGYVYRLDGRKVKVSFRVSLSFCFKDINNESTGKALEVQVHRFVAYCYAFDKFKKYSYIGFKSENKKDVSLNNLDFGFPSEHIDMLKNSISIEQTAILLGYSISKEGVLYYCGFPCSRYFLQDGYPSFSVTLNSGKPVVVRYHRLQAFQKYGLELLKEGVIVRHLDDVRTNCAYENISIGDYNDNYNDIPEDVIKDRYSRTVRTRARYSLKDRENLRKDFDHGLNYKQLAVKYNYSLSTVYRINVLER